MQVSGLYIYPLKGGAAVELPEAVMTPKGLRHDRVLMAIDPVTHAAVTQRENPKLAQVVAVPGAYGVKISAPGQQHPVHLIWEELEGNEKVTAQIHGAAAGARYAADATSEWLSDAIGQKVALVYQPPSVYVPVDPAFAKGAASSFADGYPLLVAFTASLDDLNKKIVAGGNAAVPMSRFRPNIVVANDTPWEEDTIGGLKIGGVEIGLVKPCARCVVTTLDQQTGAKAGKEPLSTLATFRFSPPRKGVLFAENAVPRSVGIIRTGDAVDIAARREAPEFKAAIDRKIK